MVFKPVCCVCGQEIRPWHLFWMPTPGQHICIPCSEKEDPEEEEKSVTPGNSARPIQGGTQ